MGTHMEKSHVRMLAQINRQRSGTGLAAQQKGNRRGSGGVALEGFLDGAAECGGTILVEQLDQLRGLRASRFSLCESQVQQFSAFWNGLLYASAWRGVVGLALEFQHRLLMGGVEHELVPVISADMAGKFSRAIENAHGRVA